MGKINTKCKGCSKECKQYGFITIVSCPNWASKFKVFNSDGEKKGKIARKPVAPRSPKSEGKVL